MKVKFIANFDWSPPEKPRVTIAYKKGMVMAVRRVCADEAIAKGKAIEVKNERRRASRETVI